MSQETKRLYERYNVENTLSELEQISAIKTHEFRNLQTPARILYGAFDCGDISGEELKEAYLKLKSVDAQVAAGLVNHDGTEINFGFEGMDIDSFIERAEELKSKLPISNSKPLADIIGQGKVLLIDDESKKFGWNIVFDTIFGAGRMLYCEGVEDSSIYISENVDSLSVVLLDLRLKDAQGQLSPKTGLQLLKQLKRDHIDLPVVVFSGVDETFFTRECLYAGASNYYVKETTDRNRLKYYSKFKMIIQEAMGNPEFRVIWRQIRGLPKPNRHLLKAYYFLTIYPQDYKINLLLLSGANKAHVNPSVHDECVLHCAVAVEEWVNRQINRRRKRIDRTESTEIAGISVFDLPVRRGIREGKLQILHAQKVINDEQKVAIDELLDMRNVVAHASRPGTHQLGLTDALRAFEIALSVVAN
jgi:CheY-like chemotaxis protein